MLRELHLLNFLDSQKMLVDRTNHCGSVFKKLQQESEQQISSIVTNNNHAHVHVGQQPKQLLWPDIMHL